MKNEIRKRLSTLEFRLLNKRVSEISRIQDLCNPDFDADVLENLHQELCEIKNRITVSLKTFRKLKLIKCGF